MSRNKESCSCAYVVLAFKRTPWRLHISHLLVTLFRRTSTGSAQRLANLHTHTNTHADRHPVRVGVLSFGPSVVFDSLLRICQKSNFVWSTLEPLGEMERVWRGRGRTGGREEGNMRVRRGGRERERERAIKDWNRRNLVYNSKSLSCNPLSSLPLLSKSLLPPQWRIVWSPSLHNHGDMSGRTLCGHRDSWLAHPGWAATGRKALKHFQLSVSIFNFKRTVPRSAKC